MKRFYRTAEAVAVEGGWQVVLDGRKIRTQGGRPQVVPTKALADTMAAEWSAQGEEIDPAGFPIRDLADYAIDVVKPDPAAVAKSLLRFAETDTLCYRAEPDDAFGIRQRNVWEPLVTGLEARLGARFVRLAGVIHRPQPQATIDALHAAMAALDSFALAGLNTLASLAASLVVGLAALEPDADPDALFAASNLEEDWQAEFWGNDEAAQAVRARRLATFREAARFVRLSRVRDDEG